jgi:hypothetical protein
MIRGLSVFLGLLSLTGCISTQHVWVDNIDGNQLRIEQQRIENYHRVIFIQNTNRSWVGSLAGGEEKVAARKQYLESRGELEAKKVCKPDTPIKEAETNFIMVENDAMAYGGGLIGYAIASGMADYKNLPTAMYYYYRCPKDQVKK